MIKNAAEVAMHLILTHGSEVLDDLKPEVLNEVLRLIILAQENAVLKTLKSVKWNCHLKEHPLKCARCKINSRWNYQELSGLTIDGILASHEPSWGQSSKILSLDDLKTSDIFNFKDI